MPVELATGPHSSGQWHGRQESAALGMAISFISLGMVGWVPTVELTVHLRGRPAPGWLMGAFWANDLRDGRVVVDQATPGAAA